MGSKWTKRCLGDLVEFRNGVNFTRASGGSSIKVVGVGDFQRKEVIDDFSSTTHVTINGDVLGEGLLADDDLLFVRSNGNKALVGRCVLVRGVTEPITFSGFTIRARITAANVEPRFLSKLVRSSLFWQHLHWYGSGSSINNLSQEVLRDFSFALPPITEQKKIAEVIGIWDEAVDKLSSLRIAKTRLRDGVLQKFFSPLPNPNGRSKVKKVTFGDVFTERQDRSHGMGPDDVVTVGKYAIRKQSEHFTRSVASSDLSGYWTISPGDFVYDPMSAYYGALGRYTGTSDGVVSPAYRVLRLRGEVLPQFMVYVLKSHRVRFLLETRSSQGNKQGKRRLLQRDEFLAINFVLPSQNEQRAFVDTVSQFEEDVERTTELLKAVQQQKQGLMQKLFTGEWRLPC